MLGFWKAAGAAGSALAAGALTAGGWAVVTVRDLPEYVVAGREYRVEFEVRQHGMRLLSGLEPELVVRTASRRALFGGDPGTTIRAAGLPAAGSYAATFTAPSGERVYLTIKNGFGGEVRLYPVAVIAPGASPPAMSAPERGRALFVAKGCNTCHANTDLTDRPGNAQYDIGPSLGGRRLPVEFVAQKLTQPASERMPNLGLSDGEVRALAVFLNGASGAAQTGR